MTMEVESPPVEIQRLADIAATLKQIRSSAYRRMLKKKDRKRTREELERLLGKLAATCPTSAWAERVASKDNAKLWPIDGMVLCQSLVEYMGRRSRRFTPSIAASVEDLLDLMSIGEADRYRHPSSCGSLVTYAQLKRGYRDDQE